MTDGPAAAPPLDPDGLYHLATVEQWDEARRRGAIEPESLATEGFVHCSWGRQVAGTVARHFGEVPDLLALRLDAGALGGVAVVEEDSYGSGQAFPHVYGAIPVAAVLAVVAISSAGAGGPSG